MQICNSWIYIKQLKEAALVQSWSLLYSVAIMRIGKLYCIWTSGWKVFQKLGFEIPQKLA